MRIASAAIVLAALGFWAWTRLRTKTNVRVNVDVAHIVRTVDARLFGINTAIWDALLDADDTVSILRELDVQALRFPGGSFSDIYHWASHTLGTNGAKVPTSFANCPLSLPVVISAIETNCSLHLSAQSRRRRQRSW